MKLHHAIEEVSKFYIPGAVGFYDQLKPNPWQQACDDLDAEIIKAIKINDNSAEEIACKLFVERLRNLCDNFKRIQTLPSDLSVKDAFYIADVDKVKRWQSVRDKTCISCSGKEKLKLRASKSNPNEVEIICAKCA